MAEIDRLADELKFDPKFKTYRQIPNAMCNCGEISFARPVSCSAWRQPMPVADAEFNSAAWEKSGKRYNQLASGSVPRARVAASAETIEAREMMGRIASADEKTRKQIEELLAKAAAEAETKNDPFYSVYIYS